MFVRAIVGLAFHPKAPGTLFNIGSTEEISILALAERIRDLASSRSEIQFVPYSEAYAPGFEDMVRRVPHTARVAALLGWRPEYNPETARGRCDSCESCAATRGLAHSGQRLFESVFRAPPEKRGYSCSVGHPPDDVLESGCVRLGIRHELNLGSTGRQVANALCGSRIDISSVLPILKSVPGAFG